MRQNAFDFFFEQAGYSYQPATESEFAGKTRCATDLARAEFLAWDKGYTFHWDVDPTMDSSEWDTENPPHQVWDCLMRDASGMIVACLGGVDFGADGEPWSDPYKRVVEAELAMEQLL